MATFDETKFENTQNLENETSSPEETKKSSGSTIGKIIAWEECLAFCWERQLNSPLIIVPKAITVRVIQQVMVLPMQAMKT